MCTDSRLQVGGGPIVASRRSHHFPAVATCIHALAIKQLLPCWPGMVGKLGQGSAQAGNAPCQVQHAMEFEFQLTKRRSGCSGLRLQYRNQRVVVMLFPLMTCQVLPVVLMTRSDVNAGRVHTVFARAQRHARR